MDEAKLYNDAYEYLCHLEEAKIWMESILKEPLPTTLELDENLRNGVYLAKIGNFIAPDVVPLSRIYDIFQHRYKNSGLQFRHTDNINSWIEALKSIGFPKMFLVETTDVYDKKNMPKVIYCIHALSAHLFGWGQAPLIQDLYGKINFSKQDIDLIYSDMKQKGTTVPSFQKIGSLLAKEFSGDVESLHQEIIKINKAIDDQAEVTLLEHLKSPKLNLAQVIPEYISYYLSSFKMAKKEKISASQNKSVSEVYEPDIYDKLLNKSEIQGHIRKVNIDCTWQDILNSIKKNKRENLKEIMSTSFTEIKDFTPQNIEYYINEALALDLNQLRSNKSRDTIQTIIRNGNRNAKEQGRVSDAISKVKTAILMRNTKRLLTALRAPALKLSSQVSDFAASLYLEEMEADLKMSQELNYKDLKSSVLILNEIAKLTSAVDSRSCDAAWTILSNAEIPFINVDPALKTQYFKSLFACREEKLSQNIENHLLTFLDIQECIDMTNMEDFLLTKALMNLAKINEAVQSSDATSLTSALQQLISEQISDDDTPLYLLLLKKRLEEKQRNSDEELWIEDVMDVVQELKDFHEKATTLCEDLANEIKFNNTPTNVLRSIENRKCDNKNIHGNENSKKPDTKVWSPDTWAIYNLSNNVKVFINPVKKMYKWSKPEGVNLKNAHFITLNDAKVSYNNKSSSTYKVNETNKYFDSVHQIIGLQAIIRGFLVRRKLEKMSRAAVIIQNWWKNIKLKRSSNSKNAQNSVPCDLNSYLDVIDQIVKIQSFWRGYQCRKKLSLKPFQVLKNLASSGQVINHDYSIDLKVQAMKSSVVETIKRNQELSCRLEEMDMKIGLLVQNRMSIEAIVAENKKFQNVHSNMCESKGIKAFSKEAKKLLDGYQQLFYLLQTDPAYLTRLIVCLPTRSNHLIQSCVLSLFNYGSNSRDAYLLLRLFRSALSQEVYCKFVKPIDAVTGNPLVLRLAVAFARQAEGHNPLRNILGFLIEKVLNDKTLIDTNPVDIYRRWINQMEMKTGKCSELPLSVTQDAALAHPEVVHRLNHNLRILKSWVKCFLEKLSHSVNQFPYALRFIAKLLRDALLKKFPDTPEKDILKIVGNLVYYQYINSAIVAPDAFYIISLPPDQHLKVEQRRNLASIAKILHFAAAKKGFGEESKHLMTLNPFIVECHEEMKKFCRKCCAVEDLEDHFHVTKYSEAALIEKPRIYITLEEIRECHKLLLEVRQEVAPDPMDPVHEILDDLGATPSLATLIGYNNSSESTSSRAGKIQVCLELDNKFQNPPEDPTEAEKLFIRTKELITSKLNDLRGDTLAEAIRNPCHENLATNLTKLELAGLVRSANDYQDILKSLIKDLSHKQEYRILQNQEINVLKTAQHRLNEKKKFYEDQLALYEQYLKTCLSNLRAPCNRTKQKKEKSVKYSGTRLRDKGILIALEGVPPGQLKNVQFEISTTKFSGIFSVQGRFMGIEVEKIDIDIQELLKLQFEGSRVMDLFGKAQINVNLLLHLLNKKFHGNYDLIN